MLLSPAFVLLLLLRSVHRTNAGEDAGDTDEKKIMWPSDEVGQIVEDVLLGEFLLSILVLPNEESNEGREGSRNLPRFSSLCWYQVIQYFRLLPSACSPSN
jgi:hypothetical protein